MLLSGKTTLLLLSFFALIIALGYIQPATSEPTIRKFGGPLALKPGGDKSSGTITLPAAVNLCDVSGAASLVICTKVATLLDITVKIGTVSLPLKRTADECFVATACSLFAAGCAETTTLEIEIKKANDNVAVNYLISGRSITALPGDEELLLDTASSVYIPTTVGTCTDAEQKWQYVIEGTPPTCSATTADKVIGMIYDFKKTEKIAALDENDVTGKASTNKFTAKCSAGGDSSSSSSSPTSSKSPSSSTTSDARGRRMGSVSAMLVAATVSTFGAMALSA